jgi:DNA transformation protein and related proteins
MAGSPAFARIERDVLRLVDSIPSGHFSTFELIGATIDVPARHVAYILSQQSEEARVSHPVHRVVGKFGKLPAKPANLAQQLQSEGLHVERQAVVDADLCYTPKASATSNSDNVRVERTTRPAEHRRTAQGEPALSELCGLGPASVAMLASVKIRSAKALRQADLYVVYAKIRSLHPKTSINLLYAMMGAVEDIDWRVIARERRSEVLMQLDDRGLLTASKSKKAL